MNAILFVLWLIIGLCVLGTNGEKVSKTSYFLVWLVLMAQLFVRLL